MRHENIEVGGFEEAGVLRRIVILDRTEICSIVQGWRIDI